MAIFRRGPPKPVWMGYIKQVALLSQTPRDASWLSVVSFNSTIPEAQFFITSYFSFWFSRAYNLILFCCLRRNVQPCCHTHDSRPPWLCIARDRTWSISHGTQQRVDRVWSSSTRRKQNAGRRVRNTNYGAAVIDCKARLPDNISRF